MYKVLPRRARAGAATDEPTPMGLQGTVAVGVVELALQTWPVSESTHTTSRLSPPFTSWGLYRLS